jgi:hypothetical protein
MKRSTIQASSAARSGLSGPRLFSQRPLRWWPGSVLVALPFVLYCALSGCGNSDDDAPPVTSGNGNNPSSTNGAGSGDTMTVTEPNQPGSNEANPNPTLQNPDDSANGAAGRNRADAGAPSTTPINPAASGLVPCGPAGRFCEKPNLTCCTPGGGAGQGANAATCQASADACPMGTVTISSCSSAASCAGSEVCCRTPNAPAAGGAMGGGAMGGGAGNNGTTSSCADSCAAGSVQVCLSDAECGAGFNCGNNGTCVAAPCTGAANGCAAGAICCRGGGAGAVGACVAPAAGGACPNAGQRRLCALDTDCPAGNSCAPIAAGGGGGGGAAAPVLACTPAACTPGSCGAGQLCCVGGGGAGGLGAGGGAPACAAASAAGACPGNARLVCATDGDCAGVAGTACLTAPNGMGALSCRVPPAPPPAADAGAGG